MTLNTTVLNTKKYFIIIYISKKDVLISNISLANSCTLILLFVDQLCDHRRHRAAKEYLANCKLAVLAMSVSLVLLVHRRPRAHRHLDADVSLLPDQGVPDVFPCRRAVLHQHSVPCIEPRQGGHGIEYFWATGALSVEIFVGSHLVHRRDRADHRGEIRKCKVFLRKIFLDTFSYHSFYVSNDIVKS